MLTIKSQELQLTLRSIFLCTNISHPMKQDIEDIKNENRLCHQSLIVGRGAHTFKDGGEEHVPAVPGRQAGIQQALNKEMRIRLKMSQSETLE